MNRLDGVLPEWTRRAWVSHEAQTVWEPRLTAIGVAWDYAEIASVERNVRPSALRFCTPAELPKLTAKMAAVELSVVVLGQSPVNSDSYSSSGSQYIGGAFNYRIAICKPEDMGRWTEVWAASDNDKIGQLLGFSSCCREFFNRVWVTEDHVDTSWPMAINSAPNITVDGSEIIIPEGGAGANILLRWWVFVLFRISRVAFIVNPPKILRNQWRL